MKGPPDFCTRCNGQLVKADKVEGTTGHGLHVTVFKDPEAVLLKQPASTNLIAYVCVECGYADLYAEDPRSLVR